MAKPDWKAIEADYLATGMSYTTLAKKWSVSLSTLKKKAAAGQWGAKFADIVQQTEPAPAPKKEPEPGREPEPQAEMITAEEMALELRAMRQRRFNEVTDAMMDRIINALELIEPDNTLALSTLVKALKDLREMQGLNKSALDIEEQRARIEKIKSEIRRDDEQSREPLVIEFVNTDGAEV